MKILTLYNDGDGAESPCDWNDKGFQLHSFSNRHKSFTHPREFWPDGKPSIGLRRKLDCGTAFVLDYFEHSGCVWSLHGSGPRCQWDTADRAGILIWNGKAKDLGRTVEERRAAAKSFLETYTCWCNGEIYGFSVDERVKLDCGHEEVRHVDSCGGYYGTDMEYMFQLIRDAVNGDSEVEVKGEAKWLADNHDYQSVPKKEKADA